LWSVAATSATNAWAVGRDSNGLQVLHWNGTSWLATPSPTPGMFAGAVTAVTATSTTNAWLAGSIPFSGHLIPFTEHWNGTAWTVTPSPTHGTFNNSLASVAATSTSNAWAAGVAWLNNNDSATLIEHWNGSTWMVTPSP
jgi:hypothetical protein